MVVIMRNTEAKLKDDRRSEYLEERGLTCIQSMLVEGVRIQKSEVMHEEQLYEGPHIAKEVSRTDVVHLSKIKNIDVYCRLNELTSRELESNPVETGTKLRILILLVGDVVNVHQGANDNIDTTMILTKGDSLSYKTHQVVRSLLLERVIDHDVTAVADFEVEGPDVRVDSKVGLAKVLFRIPSIDGVTNNSHVEVSSKGSYIRSDSSAVDVVCLESDEAIALNIRILQVDLSSE
jgi:ribosomal protein L24